MTTKLETVVSSTYPMPKGYAFLPKGNAYKTLHCRRRTQASGKPVYVVEDKQHKKTGILIPSKIFFEVNELARNTLATRRANTQKRDANVLSQAQAELKKLYPTIPEGAAERCLKRAFRKHSGRVGRTGKIEMKKKVELAVIAHVRHEETAYDAMLAKGVKREEARSKVWPQIQGILQSWKGKKIRKGKST